jgi:hypothetical protein
MTSRAASPQLRRPRRPTHYPALCTAPCVPSPHSRSLSCLYQLLKPKSIVDIAVHTELGIQVHRSYHNPKRKWISGKLSWSLSIIRASRLYPSPTSVHRSSEPDTRRTGCRRPHWWIPLRLLPNVDTSSTMSDVYVDCRRRSSRTSASVSSRCVSRVPG